MSEEAFKAIIVDSGVPTTAEELTAEWQTVVTDSGSSISNSSEYSPFWRLVSSLVTTPVLWLVNEVLVKQLMPEFFLQTVSGAFVELWSQNYGVTRKTSQAAEGLLTFRLDDAGTGSGGELLMSIDEPGIVIPAGTQVASNELNGVVLLLVTSEDTQFPAGASLVHVAVTAEAHGVAYNLPADSYTTLVEPIDGVSVTNDDGWLTKLGTDEETLEALRERTKTRFNTLGQYHTDGVYKSIIADFPGVDASNIWFEHNAPRGPGTANVYLLFELSADGVSLLVEINRHITDEGHHGHGDDLLVKSMPETTHDMTATVWFAEELLDSQREAAIEIIEVAIGSAFRNNAAYSMTLVNPFSRFSMSLLAKELHGIVEGLTSIDFDIDDIVSALAVPRLGELTIVEGEA